MKKLIIASALIAVAASASAKTTVSDQSRYYVKGSVGYAQSKNNLSAQEKGHVLESISKKGKGFVGAVGFGYNLSPNVRSEVEFLFDDGLKARKAFADGQSSMQVKRYAGLVNFAYDFKNTSRVTPFVMGGVGYAKNKLKMTEQGFSHSKSKNDFIYQAGAGVTFEVEKNVHFELGYRAIGDNFKYTLPKSNIIATRKGYTHVGMAALRVNF